MTEKKIKIDVYVNNELPGFRAYLRPVDESTLIDKHAIVMNIGAHFEIAVEHDDIDAKEALVETLMHEFGHVLEREFSLPVNEERIEDAVMRFRDVMRNNGISNL